jgi:hypothetical protein
MRLRPSVARGYDPIEVKQRTCQTCGMLLDDAGEFHPYVFCVLKRAGRDPWDGLLWVNEQLGVDVTHWPKRPPLVRTLRKLEEAK